MRLRTSADPDRLRSAAPGLIALGCALMLLAWAVAQPPFRAPDEVHHYVRTLAVSQGELLGERAGYRDPALTPRQARAVDQTARRVEVPPGLAPRGESSVVTPVGGYQPLPYLLPALAVRAGDGPLSGNRLGRLAGALACLGLLMLAGRLLWDPEQGCSHSWGSPAP